MISLVQGLKPMTNDSVRNDKQTKIARSETNTPQISVFKKTATDTDGILDLSTSLF